VSSMPCMFETSTNTFGPFVKFGGPPASMIETRDA
jgi:hypothetical protein